MGRGQRKAHRDKNNGSPMQEVDNQVSKQPEKWARQKTFYVSADQYRAEKALLDDEGIKSGAVILRAKYRFLRLFWHRIKVLLILNAVLFHFQC